MDQNVNLDKNLVEKPAEATKPQEVDLETEKSAKVGEEYDEQINTLAQMLGMSPNELVRLAKELGFNVEDLKDVKKLALFMQKLGVMLELDDSQKEILVKLATEVSKQVKTEDVANAGLTKESPKMTENETNTSSNNKTLRSKKSLIN
jgi:flagellar hook-length control protein FliK